MNAIVAVDSKWGIGKNNDLLFKLNEDMKFFRQTTLNKVVIMGYNTLLSLPNSQPLKNRISIILGAKEGEGYIACANISQLFELIKDYNDDDVFVAGGAMTYKTLLPYCKMAYVTKVQANGGASVFFPNLDNEEGWNCIYQSQQILDGEHQIKFTTYQNSLVKKEQS